MSGCGAGKQGMMFYTREQTITQVWRESDEVWLLALRLLVAVADWLSVPCRRKTRSTLRCSFLASRRIEGVHVFK